MKSQMREADRHAVQFVLIIGEDELANAQVTVRPLGGGEQAQVAMTEVTTWLRERL
jgi:histidyl-tRNA synthetase